MAWQGTRSSAKRRKIYYNLNKRTRISINTQCKNAINTQYKKVNLFIANETSSLIHFFIPSNFWLISSSIHLANLDLPQEVCGNVAKIIIELRKMSTRYPSRSVHNQSGQSEIFFRPPTCVDCLADCEQFSTVVAHCFCSFKHALWLHYA